MLKIKAVRANTDTFVFNLHRRFCVELEPNELCLFNLNTFYEQMKALNDNLFIQVFIGFVKILINYYRTDGLMHFHQRAIFLDLN